MRTLFVTVSPLLGEVVAAVLLPRLPLDVIGSLETRENLAARLRAQAPDLVLLGLRHAEPETCAQDVLAALPSAKILAMMENGAQAWLFAAGAPPLGLADLSAHTLVQALAAHLNLPPPQG